MIDRGNESKQAFLNSVMEYTRSVSGQEFTEVNYLCQDSLYFIYTRENTHCECGVMVSLWAQPAIFLGLVEDDDDGYIEPFIDEWKLETPPICTGCGKFITYYRDPNIQIIAPIGP